MSSPTTMDTIPEPKHEGKIEDIAAALLHNIRASTREATTVETRSARIDLTLEDNDLEDQVFGDTAKVQGSQVDPELRVDGVVVYDDLNEFLQEFSEDVAGEAETEIEAVLLSDDPGEDR
eukprot:scaffold13509_cov157-Amphora_coffeaeformis.AAC.3